MKLVSVNVRGNLHQYSRLMNGVNDACYMAENGQNGLMFTLCYGYSRRKLNDMQERLRKGDLPAHYDIMLETASEMLERAFMQNFDIESRKLADSLTRRTA